MSESFNLDYFQTYISRGYLLFSDHLTLLPFGLFIFILISVLARTPQLFTKKHGRTHAITGASYLVILFLGFCNIWLPFFNWQRYGLLFHCILGLSGIVLTLTAAYEFKHNSVKNMASGVLDEHATVTHKEMIEHSFYQILNLFQIIYLHFITMYDLDIMGRTTLLIFVTCPWIFRGLFPVNHFSDNYKQKDEKSTSFIRLLYRIKKYQVFRSSSHILLIIYGLFFFI